MPTFLPNNSNDIVRWGCKLDAYVDIYACREVELLQFVHCISRWLENIDQAFVGAYFKLVHRLLVYMHRPVYSELSIRVGMGTGPETRAPDRLAVSTMSFEDWSTDR